jgi:hypothetical protein
MNRKFAIGAAVACLGFAPVSMAEIFEVSFDMTGTTVEQGQYVYGALEDMSDYAGYDIVGIGIRDLEVEYLDGTEIWAMDIPGYGAGIWTWVSDGGYVSGDTMTYNWESANPAAYGAVVASDLGGWNIGTFVGSAGVDNGLTVLGGEMYYILDGVPVPAPAALAVFAMAGIARKRRRTA